MDTCLPAGPSLRLCYGHGHMHKLHNILFVILLARTMIRWDEHWTRAEGYSANDRRLLGRSSHNDSTDTNKCWTWMQISLEDWKLNFKGISILSMRRLLSGHLNIFMRTLSKLLSWTLSNNQSRSLFCACLCLFADLTWHKGGISFPKRGKRCPDMHTTCFQENMAFLCNSKRHFSLK